jgi:hypothetical protein
VQPYRLNQRRSAPDLHGDGDVAGRRGGRSHHASRQGSAVTHSPACGRMRSCRRQGYAGHWCAASPNGEPQRSQPRCDLPSGAPAGPNGPVGFHRRGRTRHHDRGRTARPPTLSLPASGCRSRDSSMPMSCSVAKASWPWRKACRMRWWRFREQAPVARSAGAG